MGKILTLQINFQLHDDTSLLTVEDLELLKGCQGFLTNAYAPYSQFQVSAAVRLQDGAIFHGTNQENASFPLGLCAERVVLNYVKANFPKAIIDTLAITSRHLKKELDDPIPPCGGCRQVILEYELNQSSPIRLLLLSNTGKVIEFADAKSLLPMAFDPTFIDPFHC